MSRRHPSLPLVCALVALLLPALVSAQENKRIAQGYLYIEPYQARFECLLDLRTVLDWLAIPGTRGDSLSPDSATAVLEKAASLAGTWCVFRVEGGLAETRLAIHEFVGGEPGRTVPLPKGGAISVPGTMLGLMWECPLGAEPQSVQVAWQGFIDNVTLLPVSAFFGGEKEETVLSEFNAACRWNNEGRLPAPKPLAEVPKLPERPTFPLPVGAIAWLVMGALLFLLMLIKKDRRRQIPTRTLVAFIGAWLLGALMTSPLIVLRLPKPGSPVPVAVTSKADAEAIVAPLLRNVYRAFDHRRESDIYDVLERSAEGPLLKKLYLEIIDALTLDQSEAARVHVAEFASEVMEVAAEGEGFTAKTSWTALGSVGHWGHSHTRTNVCLGAVTVQPVKGNWKITAIEIQDQRRL